MRTAKDRFEHSKTQLIAASESLAEAIEWPETPAHRDSVILRFIFTIEQLWKTLKFYAEFQELASKSPMEAIRQAFALEIVNEMEAEACINMLKDRNAATHVYKESMSIAIYCRIGEQHNPLIQTIVNRVAVLPMP